MGDSCSRTRVLATVAVSGVAFLCALILAPGAALGADMSHPYKLPASQYSPSAWGTSTTYVEWTAGSSSIRVTNDRSSRGRMLSEPGEQAFDPDCWRNVTAWESHSGGESRIVVSNPSHDGRVTVPGDGHDTSPSIWQSTVVFMRDTGLDRRAYVCNLTSGLVVPLSYGAGSEDSPDIFGTRVAYEKHGDIWLQDLKTGEERLVVGRDGIQECPSIWGELIAYADWSRGLADIWVHDLRTGSDVAVVSLTGVQYAPSLHDRTLVYEQYSQPRCSSTLAYVQLPDSIPKQYLRDVASDAAQTHGSGVPLRQAASMAACGALPLLDRIGGPVSVFGAFEPFAWLPGLDAAMLRDARVVRAL